jgi:hypothetical protein
MQAIPQQPRCLFEDGGEAGKHVIYDVFGDGFEKLPVSRRQIEGRGWSQRITPVVRVPAPSIETAKPRLRAKLPPVVMGKTTGVWVSLLKGAGETISTGGCPAVHGRQWDRG